jgi:hypothetical protein
VVANSAQYVAIRKNNFIQYYAAAREKAFSPTTIRSAFRKTGIWPLDPTAIEDAAFAPALNTTTQPALPLAPEPPVPAGTQGETPFDLVVVPPSLQRTATHDEVIACFKSVDE